MPHATLPRKGSRMATERAGTTFGPDEMFGELTPREQEVASLVSQGLTNEEIARQLILTPGTVANHVAHILAKTGARSRLQVALRLVRTHSGRSTDDVLSLLTRLQTLGPTELRGALQYAVELLASFFGADACDAFLCHPGDEILVALASTRTPLAERQRALGLHHLPLSHGGRIAWVYQEQEPFRDGRVEDDTFELLAVRRDLGVQSTLAVPLAVAEDCRGVLVVRSAAPEHFGEPDLELLRFVAYWLALVAQQRTSTGDGRVGRST